MEFTVTITSGQKWTGSIEYNLGINRTEIDLESGTFAGLTRQIKTMLDEEIKDILEKGGQI